MIVILDFGSQYTQLIARRVREHKVFCEILPGTDSWETIAEKNPKALILSGGPASLAKNEKPPLPDAQIFKQGLPILGICYGMQLMAHSLGGKVVGARVREYGRAEISVKKSCALFKGLPKKMPVWMSHGDEVETLPKGFEQIATSSMGGRTTIQNVSAKMYGVQFHPEVVHSPHGSEMIANFLFHVAGQKPDWKMSSFIQEEIARIRRVAGKERVLSAISGGVDSAVSSVLVHEALGAQLDCVFVDNGLLRHGEKERLERVFRPRFGKSLHLVDAASSFLNKLKGQKDPEKKRKIIGREFIRVFDKESARIGKHQFLVQGTLYPDLIESQSVRGPSAVIKSHHNVGGLPKRMKMKLIEPLKYLFKDEVRELGRELGLPDEILGRHPFPGPGLAVRVLGEVTKERAEIIRQADRIVEEEIRSGGIYKKLWQAFAVLLPVNTVGVMGDERTYENACAIRAVTSLDAMTADWADIPKPILEKISNRIINEVRGINRVVYDISSKPPATIEWE